MVVSLEEVIPLAKRKGSRRFSPAWFLIVIGLVIALYLAVLLPVVGWFIVLPALCLWSFGAAALTLLSRSRREAVDVE